LLNLGLEAKFSSLGP